jgi:hypothetical protein
MASTVFQRVVFVERTKDGFIRFSDWALSTTTLGAMAEPFAVGGVGIGDNGLNFDATEDLSLVSDILYVNSDLIPTMLSGGGAVWVGGNLMPRTGR